MVFEVVGGRLGGGVTTGGVELFGAEKLLPAVDPVGGRLVPNGGLIKIPPLGGVELPGVDELPPEG